MAIDLSKLKIDLEQHKVDVQSQRNMEMAEAALQIAQCFPSDLLIEIANNKNTLLGKISSIPDEDLQELITNLMKEHESADELTIMCRLSIPRVDIKIKSFENTENVLFYCDYDSGIYLSLYGCDYTTCVSHIAPNRKSVPIDKRFDIVAIVFDNLCKEIRSDTGLLLATPCTWSDDEHEAKYRYNYKDFAKAISDRLNEFGLKVIAYSEMIDEIDAGDNHNLYFKVKNPLHGD